MNDQRPFGAFCLVGMGNHARTKLLPALRANGQQIAAVVSARHAEPGLRVFSDLDEALCCLPPDTVFFIATPPDLHLRQAAAIVEAGCDLFVEKPAFLAKAEAEAIIDLAAAQGTVLAEAVMYRHSRTYARLMDFWSRHRGRVRAVSMTFLIDKMPEGTFRLGPGIAASSSFDIGFYPISLLADLGLGDVPLAVTQVHFAGDRRRERVLAKGGSGPLAVALEYGVGEAYENRVDVELDDGTQARFSPFFYGRPGERTVTLSSPAGVQVEAIAEPDSFRAMLARPRPDWLADQAQRNRAMAQVTGKLRDLAEAVAAVAEHRGARP